MSGTRLIGFDDAPTLATLLVANRELMAPWSPLRDETYYTDDGQRAVIGELLAQHDEQGSALPQVVIDADRIVGCITLSGIVRGPFQSGNLGYWIDAAHNGQGLATAAVAEVTRTTFDELGLHRIQAGTLVHNIASQKVLQRNGFERFALASSYLKIAGRWQEHVLFQLLNPSA